MKNNNQLQLRRYTIFISSTFKDMDVERDIIKFNVIPALNRKFRDRFIQFQAIDLRMGINTADMDESESENKVLKVCLSSINSSRPYFIGLLGQRYGWIPDQVLLHRFISNMDETEQLLFKKAIGKSVTELEIMYGALYTGNNNLDHSYFFFREEDSYKNIDANHLPLYRDDKDLSISEKERLTKTDSQNKLKKLIISLDNNANDSHILPYSMEWDVKTSCFSYSQSFFNKVYNVLEKEFTRLSEESSEINMSWTESERISLEFFIQQCTHMCVAQGGTHNLCKDHIIIGSKGSGKSVLLAETVKYYRTCSNVIVLYAKMGFTCHSVTIRQVTARFIYQLNEELGLDNIDVSELLSEKDTPNAKLFDKYYALCHEVEKQGKKIVCVVDDLEYLYQQTNTTLYFPWRHHKNVCFFGALDRNFKNLCGNEIYNADIIDKDCADDSLVGNISKMMQHNFLIDIPKEIEHKMETQNVSPLFIKSYFVVLEYLSTGDFDKIRNASKSDIENINDYLSEIYDIMYEKKDNLMQFLLDYFIHQMSLPHVYYDIYDCIACSPTGLRESDLERIFGNKFNSLDFNLLNNILEGYIYKDKITDNWTFGNLMNRSKIMTHPERMEEFQEMIACALFRLDDSDEKKQDLALYFAIISGRYELLDGILNYQGTISDSHDFLYQYFRYSIPYLLLENDFADRIKDIGETCQDNFKVKILTSVYLLMQDVLAYNKTEIANMFIDALLKTDISTLTASVLYDYCSTLRSLWQYKKYTENNNFISILEPLTQAHILCYEKDSSCKDIKNMTVVMLSELITTYSMEGIFDKIEPTIKKLESINGESYIF